MIIKTLNGMTPTFGKECFFAENAVLIGDVEMGDNCSIWYHAVLRGDVNSIRLGDRVNIQDGAVVHGTYQKYSTTIGNNVSVGHNAIVHGCILHDNVLIGMGAIVMDGCEVESSTIVAAGAVVTKGTRLEGGTIYAGIPARKVKDIKEDPIAGEITRIAESYLKYAGWYK